MSGALGLFLSFLPLILLIVTGFLSGLYLRIDYTGLNRFLIYVAVPCLIVSSTTTNLTFPWHYFGGIFLAMCVVVFGGFLVMRVLSPLIDGSDEPWRKRRTRSMTPPEIFMSYAYTTLPFAEAVMGNQGLRIGMLIYVSGALLTYTFGVYLLSGASNLKAIAKLPFIYAFLFGLTLRFLDLSLPGPLETTVDKIGAMAPALILVAIGIQLSHMDVKHLRLGVGGGLLRICLGGLLGILAVKALPLLVPSARLPAQIQSLLIMTSMLPSAAIIAILAAHFGDQRSIVDSVVISSYVFFSILGTVLLSLVFA